MKFKVDSSNGDDSELQFESDEMNDDLLEEDSDLKR